MEWLHYHKVNEFYSQMSHTVDMLTYILVSILLDIGSLF